MNTLAAGASYAGSASLVTLFQGALAEHGVNLGQNTSILLVLALGYVIHYLTDRYGQKNTGVISNEKVSSTVPASIYPAIPQQL